MTIRYCKNYDEMSQRGAQILISEIKRKPELLICAATGKSPTGLYENLSNEYQQNESLFGKIRIVMLDEWGGIAMNDPNSCRSYLNKFVTQPFGLSQDRFFAFDSEATDPTLECLKMQHAINEQGPIDVFFLGLGKNGHLGFNEPFSFSSHCYAATLSAETLQHSMVASMDVKPSFGMTLGMLDILNSKKIVMLISGEGKHRVINKFLSQKIDRALPASFLWLHTKLECLIDLTSYKRDVAFTLAS